MGGVLPYLTPTPSHAQSPAQCGCRPPALQGPAGLGLQWRDSSHRLPGKPQDHWAVPLTLTLHAALWPHPLARANTCLGKKSVALPQCADCELIQFTAPGGAPLVPRKSCDE